VATSSDIDQLLAVIRRLPLPEQLRLVERVVHEAAQQSESAPNGSPTPVIGLFTEDPALMDAVADDAMRARERDPLRRRE
jgi:hypothetical protein